MIDEAEPDRLNERHRLAKRNRSRKLGPTVMIAVQDEHTRLVYAERHSVENGRPPITRVHGVREQDS